MSSSNVLDLSPSPPPFPCHIQFNRSFHAFVGEVVVKYLNRYHDRLEKSTNSRTRARKSTNLRFDDCLHQTLGTASLDSPHFPSPKTMEIYPPAPHSVDPPAPTAPATVAQATGTSFHPSQDPVQRTTDDRPSILQRPSRRATRDSTGFEGGVVPPLKQRLTDLFIAERRVKREPTARESFHAVVRASWLNLLLVFIPVSR